MQQTKEEKNRHKHHLNLAGEYSVCAELHKRGIDANITFGNQKATDINIIIDKQAYSVEVKTSMTKRFVTGFFQKYKLPHQMPAPDFWVLVYVYPETFISEYYVLIHEEMAKEQMKRNGMTEWKEVKGGVDNIELSQLENYKNAWNKITDKCFK